MYHFGVVVEENIIGFIAEAEQEAALKKDAAEQSAAEIVAAAEKRATELARESEAELKRLREETLRGAEERAVTAYRATLEKSRADAAAYADKILSANSDEAVSEIVGRLLK